MVESYESTTTRIAPLGTPNCTLVQDLLPLYIEGEVSPGSRDLIVEHLGRCERCAGYLAGAQSVRGQLRRDQIQRVASLQADEPQRGVVLRLRDIVASSLAMLLCLPGGGAAAAVGAGLSSGGVEELLVGLFIATVIGVSILGLARILGPLTSARLSAICGGIALGGAGMILVVLFISGGSPFGILAGFGVGVAGLVGVWSGVARAGHVPLIPI